MFTPKDWLLEMARRDFEYFVRFTKRDYEVNWHHKTIINLIKKFINKDILRLMLFMPPRTGKSELVSRRLPSYILGKNPDSNIIACSYSADLAHTMNRSVQRIIDEEEYIKLFPNTRLEGSKIYTPKQLDSFSYKRTTETFEIVGNKGVYTSAGIGGPITGKGADYLIIDDPIKNKEEAYSEVFRNKVFDWYNSTARTRIEKNGSILLTMTRWHEDDLAGRLEQLAKNDKKADQWKIVKFPALKEKDDNKYDTRKIDEPLWENKYPKDELEKIKASVGPDIWRSLYQQTPLPDDGIVFKRKWLEKFYYKLPDKFDTIIQSWDMAFNNTETASKVVCQIWGKIKAQYYLIDQLRKNMDFPETLEAFYYMTNKYPKANKKLVEEKANGPAVISTLQNKITGINPEDAKDAVRPTTSKLARAKVISYLYSSGNVLLPHPSIAPWINDYITEFCAFPNSKFDDQVDSSSQALKYLDLEKKLVYDWV